MRRLAVLSTGRQDWGILRSTCRLLQDDPGVDLLLLLGGMHCSVRFGRTEDLVREDGFGTYQTLPWVSHDGGEPAHEQAGQAVQMVGRALAREQPEALLLVGDRFETAAAALAATLNRVPLVHLHGGEETEGAFDNALRHAVTKLSHLHLVSHPTHASRVIGMGEDPAAVHVVGAPGLDNLHRDDLAGRAELAAFLKAELRPPVVLVTLHPTTHGHPPEEEAAAVCSAMDRVEATYVITLPNADPGNERIRAAFAAQAGPGRILVHALGERRYWGMLRLADAMLGNSSSAVIEAAVLGLPAVNVGDRQKGRIRGANLLDARPDGEEVTAALRRALSPAFREAARSSPCPFGDGRSAPRIVEVLRSWAPPRPPVKRSPQVAPCPPPRT